jgi:hypothetical protein
MSRSFKKILRGIYPGFMPAKKIKPRAGFPGAALRGVGDGRGLVARDAVLIESSLPYPDRIVQFHTKLF